LKANILWEAFKERLGQSEPPSMQFDLHYSLLQASSNLNCLEQPFTTEEIDLVVQHLPSDKSPGLDGFNTDFIKKCWPIIKQDFYDLCFDFQCGSICLRSINSFFVTLIPKVDEPVTVADFRPISLLISSI
jgi:hypothetical protein